MQTTINASLTIDFDPENPEKCGNCRFQFWLYCIYYEIKLTGQEDAANRCPKCFQNVMETINAKKNS
jgi:hypothetical protein